MTHALRIKGISKGQEVNYAHVSLNLPKKLCHAQLHPFSLFSVTAGARCSKFVLDNQHLRVFLLMSPCANFPSNASNRLRSPLNVAVKFHKSSIKFHQVLFFLKNSLRYQVFDVSFKFSIFVTGHFPDAVSHNLNPLMWKCPLPIFPF